MSLITNKRKAPYNLNSAAACKLKAREYAESWLNGNRSHVDTEIGGSVLKLTATYLALLDYSQQDAKQFMEYMFNSRINWRRI